MTTNAFTALRAALIQSVVNANLGIPCAHENVAFTKPKANSPWASAFVLQNQPEVATLGHDGQDAHTGILQIDLNYPLCKGDSALLVQADKLYDVYKAGARFSYSGIEVIITSCGRSRGREVDGWYRVSITVTWESRVPRN